MITLKRINELLYLHDRGYFLWKARPESSFKSKRSYSNFKTQFESRRVGSYDSKGYEKVQIDGKKYLVHRVLWCVTNFIEPCDLKDEIDHKNGDPSDNRIENLRVVSKKVNRKNRINPWNKIGVLGVKPHKSGKYEARVSCNGKQYYLGVFETKEMAHEVYVAKKKELFPGSTL
jgi:hypothetical protein